MRKQEIVFIFCFLFSGYSLYTQDFQSSPDGRTIQIFLKEKPPLELLAIYVGENTPSYKENIPAMMGNFFYKNDTLHFAPTFAFQPERSYHLFEGNKHVLSFDVPERNPTPTTTLTHIYPSADTLPENVLKMYLYFSAPMREGFAYQHIWLTDATGDTLTRPILELTPELWDIHSQRLTLWFDPGRIKRDLIPNKELGTPLEAGESYTLHISANWKDLSGKKIAVGRTHSFYVAKADRKKPIPTHWELLSPSAGNKKPLNIDFGEAMDQALALATISVWKGEQVIEGGARLIKNESMLTFTPAQKWEVGEYKILIESRLEDLAGNNLNRLFDRDMLKEPLLSEEKETYHLSFQVKN